MRAKAAPPISAAFTLVEVLVSMAILTIILLVLVQITESTRRTWRYSTEKIQEFREAREAFESMTRRLAQATLNTYWDYSPAPPAAPTKYVRQSELRFISGPADKIGMSNPPDVTHAVFFQAPIGFVEDTKYSQLQNLLNTWGYFIEWNSDKDSRPPFITDQIAPLRYRFRLMELMEPSEALTLYKFTNGNPTPPYTGRDWFVTPLTSTNPPRKRVLAENMLLMVLAPQLSTVEVGVGGLIGPNYTYDSTVDGVSKNQLPPLVRVTLVALDEASFARFQKTSVSAPSWLTGKFTNFNNTDADMKTVTDQLTAARIKYRSFTTVVPIRGAKWSTN